MLFADDTASQAAAASWIALGIAVVTMIGGVLNLMVNKIAETKSAGDKLANETEKVELRAKLSVLEERQKDCLEGHREVEAKLAKCEEGHEKSDADRSKIWAELNAIKSSAGTPAVART